MTSGSSDQDDEFGLVSRMLGGLPIVNAVLDRLGLPAMLAGALPAADARVKLAPAVAIRLVVTNLVLGREPLYGLGEWAALPTGASVPTPARRTEASTRTSAAT